MKHLSFFSGCMIRSGAMHLLVSLSLISALTAPLLLSCADSNNPQEEVAVIGTTEDNSVETTTSDPAYQEELPDKNFNDRTFTFYSYGDGTKNTWSAGGLLAEDETGEAVNDAVYYRKLNVESKYGIKFAPIVYNASKGNVAKSIAAGDNAYDAICLSMEESALCAQENLLADLREVPYLNLEKKYWDQGCRATYPLGVKLSLRWVTYLHK